MRAPVNKKKFILTAVIFFIAFGFLAMTAESAFAQEESYGFESVKEKKYGLDIVAPSSLRKTSEPSEIIGKAIGAVLAFVSVIFFLLTIYGGIIWMTARGNEQQTDKALKTITSASVGLVIVLGSYVLVGFLFKTISSQTECKTPLVGIGKECSDTNPCNLGASVVCSPNSNTCVSSDNGLCGQRCGSKFSCTNVDSCVSGTALSNYCAGDQSTVCCIPK